MASSKWLSFEELSSRNQSRRIVFWGASNWIEQTLSQAALNVSHIVDNSPFNQGICYEGFEVRAPKALLQSDESFYIVITTVNYQSVIDELHEMGFVMGEDFCCTPLLNQRANKDRIKSLQGKVLIASPVQHCTENEGGGLYTVDIASSVVEKVYQGKMRGIVKAGEFYAAVDMLKGIVLLDQNFQQVDLIEFQKNSEPHGLAYDNQRNRLIVAQPGRDSVAVYDLSTKTLVKELFISEKWAKNKKDNHHINDLYIHGDSLFVSLFSFSGNWPHECYDGGVLEMDIESGEIIGPVMSELWMPHSICRINGALTCLDSMRGELKTMNHRNLGHFNSFIRGLAFKEGYYYIGASEHRYPEKLAGISNNIGLDAGVYIFDAESKMSRFLPVRETESIHSLLVL